MQDLRKFHVDYRTGATGKLVGMLVVAAMVVTAGFFAYRDGMLTPAPRQIVTNSQLPSPGPVLHVTPKQPPEAPM